MVDDVARGKVNHDEHDRRLEKFRDSFTKTGYEKRHSKQTERKAGAKYQREVCCAGAY